MNSDDKYYEAYERVAILLEEYDNPSEDLIQCAQETAKFELMERRKGMDYELNTR